MIKDFIDKNHDNVRNKFYFLSEKNELITTEIDIKNVIKS